MIQKWEPPFNRVGHANPVTLRRQQVLGHEDGNLQILGLMQRVPAVIAAGIGYGWTGQCFHSLMKVIREEAFGAAVIAPPDGMGITGRVRLGETFAEKSGQVGAATAGEIGNVGVEPFEQLWA